VSLSRTLVMETAIRADGESFVVDGDKHFCTMAMGASHYMVWCALDGETDMGKALMLALVPADTPGLATDGKWDTLGMPGTYSPSVTFTGAIIPKDAVCIGIAEAALEFALGYAKERVVKPENIAIAQDPTVQRHLGGLAVHLDAAWLVLRDAGAGRLPRVPARARLPRRPDVDLDAADDGPHAGGHRQERVGTDRGDVSHQRRAGSGLRLRRGVCACVPTTRFG